MRNLIYVIAIFSFIQGCVEPFEAESLSFENILVIDARLTDEFKRHEVILRRTYPFDSENFEVEQNASVQINDDNGSTFDFQEEESGRYVSTTEFSANQGIGYRLSVVTADGRSYQSETAVTPKKIPVKELRAELGFNDDENEGIFISLTNTDTDNEGKFFRYEYEETFKIIAPFYNPFEWDVVDSLFFQENDNDGFDIRIKPRNDESQFCYGFNKSKDLSLSDSEQNTDNRSNEVEVRFLASDAFELSHRYSILVRQYRLSSDAYSYYRNLEDFTSSESVFSDTQPGFLDGNIKASTDDESVLGYFEVAAVNTERIFLNYTDFYPDRPLPPYIIDCQLTTAPQLLAFVPHVGPDFVVDESEVVSPLLDGIQAGLIAYHETNEDYEEPEGDGLVEGLGPFFVKATGCIDCRAFGSNVKPDFWIE